MSLIKDIRLVTQCLDVGFCIVEESLYGSRIIDATDSEHRETGAFRQCGQRAYIGIGHEGIGS